jgi:hypothetical protein
MKISDLLNKTFIVPVIDLPVFVDVERSFNLSDDEASRAAQRREITRLLKEAARQDTYYD